VKTDRHFLYSPKEDSFCWWCWKEIGCLNNHPSGFIFFWTELTLAAL
jgi:hypothetical protein